MNIKSNFVFQDAASSASNGESIKINGSKSLTISIISSAQNSARKINFMAKKDGQLKSIVGFKLGDVNFTMDTKTTGTDEWWYFDSIEGLDEMYFQIESMTGGTITIKGKMVL